MLYEFDQQQIASFTPTEATDEQIMARIQAHDESALAAETVGHRLLHCRGASRGTDPRVVADAPASAEGELCTGTMGAGVTPGQTRDRGQTRGAASSDRRIGRPTWGATDKEISSFA